MRLWIRSFFIFHVAVRPDSLMSFLLYTVKVGQFSRVSAPGIKFSCNYTQYGLHVTLFLFSFVQRTFSFVLFNDDVVSGIYIYIFISQLILNRLCL